MYCRKCGKKVPDDANFCKYCGTKFTKKEVVNGKVIVKEMEEEKKPINKNAVIALVFSIASLVCCMLPFSILGYLTLVLILLLAGISMFFRLRGKDEMYRFYDKEGMLIGKRMLDISFVLSIVCIVLALTNIARFM